MFKIIVSFRKKWGGKPTIADYLPKSIPMFFEKKVRIDDPVRLKNFLTATLSLDWSAPKEASNKLFEEINHLFHAEIEYYYWKRKRKKTGSAWVKALIWIFTTLGFLCPLIKPIYDWDKLAPLGYIFFGISTAMFLFDRLFNISSGHIRLVTTQLMLEKELTTYRVAWNELLARSAEPVAFFELSNTLVKEFYSIIDKETASWGDEIKKAMEEASKNKSNSN
ncbi:SLATT domain-containing protein [Mucilaginibacter lutimaris]|uniref:SLATT domain-containing protein n=1 Tax=Mucilaginibacter lutimaris TaxID=931629 RepID=A0ABW2ZA84_9SPHI